MTYQVCESIAGSYLLYALIPWPAQVEQVDEASGNAMAEVTVAVVEAILEPLRPAMIAMRAKVEVRFSFTKLIP